MGDGRTDSTQKDESEKAWGAALIGARKPCFRLKEGFYVKACENGIDPGTALADPGAAANAAANANVYAYFRRLRETLNTMADPGRRRPPWLVGEVLETVRPPDNVVGALFARFSTDWP